MEAQLIRVSFSPVGLDLMAGLPPDKVPPTLERCRGGKHMGVGGNMGWEAHGEE